MDNAFSVGYSGKLEDLQKILDSSKKISSVYTGGIAGKIANGRPHYVESLETIAEQAKYAHAHNVKFEIALNAPCGINNKTDTAWWDNIREYLHELQDIGVDAITASHPFLIEEVKKQTSMTVNISTICEIMNLRSALYYESMGGDVIVPSMNLNMNLPELKLIKKNLKHATIRLMVNEHCLGDCPWRRFHHNLYSHSTEESSYLIKCRKLYAKNLYLELTNNAIRPEDLHYYYDVTRDFKIVGRVSSVEDTVTRVKAYSDESFSGNYVALSAVGSARYAYIENKKLDGLLEKKLQCDKNCDECKFCMELFERIGAYKL